MTPSELATYVRFKTRTNTSTLTDDDLLMLLNTVKNEVCDRALEVDEDIFLVPTTLNLVANQREYPFKSDILSRIKRVEAMFNGSDYIKLTNIDLADIDQPIGSEAQIVARFSNEEGNAFYDIMRSSLWLYSGTITSVTNGLKVWLNTIPSNVASILSTTDMRVDPSTTAHGIPAPLHKVIAKGVVIEWKESREKPIPLTEREQKWEFDLEKAIQTMKRTDYDREVYASIPDDDGSDY